MKGRTGSDVEGWEERAGVAGSVYRRVGALTVHAGATVAATVHGYTVAMAWGVGILLVAAVPTVILVNAKAPARHQ